MKKDRFLLLLITALGLFVFASIFVVANIVMSDYENEMNEKLEVLKNQGIEHRKLLARDRIDSVVEYIMVEDRLREEKVKEKIKGYVDNAHAIASSYYSQNSAKMSKEDMKKNLLGILGNIRWDGGRGYYFVINLNGVEELNPLNRELEGKYIENLVDSKGDMFVKKMLEIGRAKGDGYVEYYWTKQSSTELLRDKKISFVRYFEPFDWIICTGEYPGDYLKDLQSDILKKLEEMRFDGSSDNYVFVYDILNINGGSDFATMLINRNRPDLVGKKLSDDVKDTNGKEYRKEMLSKIKSDGYAFVDYTYKVPTSSNVEEKVTYFRYFENWGWVVAGGLYLEDIHKQYANDTRELKKQIKEKVYIFQTLFVVLGIVLTAFGYLMLRVQKNRMDKSRAEIDRINSGLKKLIEVEVSKRMALEDEKNIREQLLVQQSKMAEIGEMIGNIAHQWKQPLNIISFLVQDLEEQQKYGELNEKTLHEFIEKASFQIDFMSHTINDFSNFFKPNKEKKSFSVLDSVDSTLRILSHQLKILLIDVKIESSADSCMIFGVENEFRQVLLNIMNNAKDALYDAQIGKKWIKVLISRVDGFVEVVIEDNGGGIDDSLLPDAIFESYISTKGEKGSGIGLYMSRMIIQKSFGGEVSAQNSQYGARFTLRIPIPTS